MSRTSVGSGTAETLRRCSRTLVLCLLAVVPAAQAVDAETFARELARAERLNIEAPWPESQAVLEALRPHLDRADGDQLFVYRMLESRNQALAGDVEASLATVEAVLERDLEPAQRLSAHTRAANVGHIARRYEQTYHHLNRALALLDEHDLREDVDNLFSIAAYMYTLVGEFDAALEFGRRAVEFAADSDDPRARCNALQRMGFVYKRRAEFEASKAHYEAARPACVAAGDALIAATVDYGLADLLSSHGQAADAEPLFDRSIEALERLGYRAGLAEARLYRARMAFELGQDPEVERLLEPALEPFRQHGNHDYEAEAQRLLAEIDRRNGRPEDALVHLTAANAAQQAGFEQMRDRQAAFLRVRFELAERERELALLREQQALSALEASARSQRALLRAGLGAMTALLLIVLLVLWIRAVRDRRRFRRLSERDALTALSNHTRFFELAERTLALARQKRQPYTLILADIDHFKQVNDRHGHLVGDRVLRRVGSALRREFGDSGIIGRVGGEEFALALPGPEPAEIHRRLARFRRALHGIEGLDRPLTMSFGMAKPRANETLTVLRARADRRLYAAKQAGRDRVVDSDADA